jgi:hypothetical protein
MPLVGILCAGTAQALERDLSSFRECMRRVEYVEGSNLRFEFRFADRYLELLPEFAIELVHGGVTHTRAPRKPVSASGAMPTEFRRSDCWGLDRARADGSKREVTS